MSNATPTYRYMAWTWSKQVLDQVRYCASCRTRLAPGDSVYLPHETVPAPFCFCLTCGDRRVALTRPPEPWYERYAVVTTYVDRPPWGLLAHLKVRQRDGSNIPIPWEDLQQLKDEFVGPETTMIEVYPPADQVVNDEPIRHLWEVPEGVVFPISLYRRYDREG